MKLIISLLITLVVIESALAFDCCVPDHWQGSSLTTTSTGELIEKTYYYDAINLRTRIDTRTNTGFNQTTYSYYPPTNKTGTEWVMDVTADQCFQTGPDFWNYQCFGQTYGLPLITQTQYEYIFYNADNGISVVTTKGDRCLPVSMSFGLAGTTTDFLDVQPYITDDKVFDLPSQCKQ
ncbi:hypothetical protein SAMD00019534_095900, partial [Acytostelium subglobosum LB1]|uniref:hypothetical protein n=1 Tax=Acytostelium subglobosum LB1 TaxID=1410327 RepID=UPI000644C2BD